jgi:hypothetical protein
MEQLRVATEAADMTVTIGSSEVTLFILGGLAILAIILITVGLVMQRRLDKKHRLRNRRK